VTNVRDDKYDYQKTLIEANHYYETSLYVAKKNEQYPRRGKGKSINHGYSTHGVKNQKKM
jgi:hypothetical protein